MSCASLVPCQNPQITLVLEHSVPARPRGPRGGVQGPTHTCKKHCPVYHAVGGGGAARPVTRLMAPSGSKLMAPSAFGSASKFGFFLTVFCACAQNVLAAAAPPQERSRARPRTNPMALSVMRALPCARAAAAATTNELRRGVVHAHRRTQVGHAAVCAVCREEPSVNLRPVDACAPTIRPFTKRRHNAQAAAFEEARSRFQTR